MNINWIFEEWKFIVSLIVSLIVSQIVLYFKEPNTIVFFSLIGCFFLIYGIIFNQIISRNREGWC